MKKEFLMATRKWTQLASLVSIVCLLSPSLARADEPWLPITETLADASGQDVLDFDGSVESGSYDESPYDEPLVTDRPDFTESSSTVGLDVIQLEMGYSFVYNDDDATGDETHTHTAPEILLRYGFLDSVELRVGWTYGWEETEVGGMHDATDGGSDLSIGLKIDLFEQCCWRPEQAVIVSTASDSGATHFSSNTFTAGVTYTYGWELANEWALGANTGFFTDREGADDFVVWLQSVAIGIPINDCWGFYAEYFGLYESHKAGAIDQHFMNVGLTYLVTNNLQFDVRVGMGLNADAEDFFTGTGVSMRF